VSETQRVTKLVYGSSVDSGTLRSYENLDTAKHCVSVVMLNKATADEPFRYASLTTSVEVFN